MNYQISASVREVVAALTAAPDWESFPIPKRERLGQLAHRAFCENRSSAQHEVTVKGEYCSIDGSIIHLNGRIDVIEKHDGKFTIYEFKSVLLQPPSVVTLSELPTRFSLQAQIYAYLFLNSLDDYPMSDIECRVVLHNLADETEYIIKVPWSPVDVETELERYVELFTRKEAETAAQRERRRLMAKSLSWPFETFRTGQDEIVDAVGRAFSEGGDILVEAPTGIGKTVAALYPTLKHSLLLGSQLFFATTKSGGRNPIVQAIKSLSSESVQLHTMILPPHNELCSKALSECNTLDCSMHATLMNDTETGELPSELLKPGIITTFELREAGETSGICPMVLARLLSLQADVVIGDCNFVFSPQVRLPQFRDEVQGDWVLLMDEAHNLFDRVRAELSAELHYNNVLNASQLLKDELWLHADEPSAAALAEGLGALIATCERIFEDSLPEEEAIELEAVEWSDLADRIGMAMAHFIAATLRKLDRDLNQALWKVYTELTNFSTVLQRDRETYLYYIDRSDWIILACCLDPRQEMKNVYQHFTNVAGFSGTLSPLDFHSEALGFGERPLVDLTASGWFDRSRQMVAIAAGVNTRFYTRSHESSRIAGILYDFIKLHKGGYLAVFPSFEFLTIVESYLSNDRSVDILVQARGMKSDERLRFKEALNRKDKTTLAMVVAGGQFTEAEDYPGDACVGVVIVGPFLPPPDPVREALRTYWDRRGVDGYSVAYFYPGIRRVIQAGGRLFRRSDDRGVILLVGDRFQSPPIWDLLPEDWRISLAGGEGNWQERVANFWRNSDDT